MERISQFFVSSKLSVLARNFRRFLELLLAAILEKEDRYERAGPLYTAAVNAVKAWKNSSLNGIRTHDSNDTDAVLYQLSYQANWELVTAMLVKKQIHTEIATCY